MITTTTAARKPVFCNWIAATAACRAIARQTTWGDASLLCWVLMPDHWHGVIQLGDRDSLAVVVNRFKACIAKAVHLEIAQEAIWARAYHDHACATMRT